VIETNHEKAVKDVEVRIDREVEVQCEENVLQIVAHLVQKADLVRNTAQSEEIVLVTSTTKEA